MMTLSTQFQHPLLRRPGSSQGRRVSEGLVPQLKADLIDNRSLADFLDYIHQYARHVVFPEYKVDGERQEHVELANWLPLFENSLPFRLARFGKTDFNRLEHDLAAHLHEIIGNPVPSMLEPLLDFCFSELIEPVARLHKAADKVDFSLSFLPGHAIPGSLAPVLARIIQLGNTARYHFCLDGRPLDGFCREPWCLQKEKIYKRDGDIVHASGGHAGAVLWLKDELRGAAMEMLQFQRQIAREALGQLDAGIAAAGGSHEPHVGLLLAFLRLYRNFQGDLNQLTVKHLDFFYQDVLQLKPQEAVRDKARVVFEVSKHLEKHPIKAGTLFRNGKDANKVDILFSLDEDMVIDKARVAELKTFYLNPARIYPAGRKKKEEKPEAFRPVVEGLYIAPVADSLDGKGEPFKEGQSRNWPTLGGKFGKLVSPATEEPLPHPFARVGFILSSPVLWLNEGRREVKISITCEVEDNGGASVQEIYEAVANLQVYTYGFGRKAGNWIESRFSEKAKRFLARKLQGGDRRLKLDGSDSGEELNPGELGCLKQLFGPCDAKNYYVIREMPFTSLMRRVKALGNGQYPYPLGRDPVGFFTSEDPVTCRPLLPGKEAQELKGKLEEDKPDLFSLEFSGEEGWFPVKKVTSKAEEARTPGSSLPDSSFKADLTRKNKQLLLNIEAVLDADDPRVAFYNEEVFKENLDTGRPFPMVKIELNPALQGEYTEKGNSEEANGEEKKGDRCCLENEPPKEKPTASFYQFFRDLKVTCATIEVTVCGMRDLVVQNENSLQDVNEPIQLFGPRPTVGAEFYIGNKELFGKYWQKFWLRTAWKDKPVNLEAHYEEYGRVRHESENDRAIDSSSFRFRAAVQHDSGWIGDQSEANLFRSDDLLLNPCPQCEKHKHVRGKKDGKPAKKCRKHSEATPLFTPGDIIDLPGLIAKITKTEKPGLVSEQTKYFLRDIRKSPDKKEEELANEFNKILKSGIWIYEKERFSEVKLSQETIELLEKTQPTETEVILLNRLLIQDAYPKEIAKLPLESAVVCHEFQRECFNNPRYDAKSLDPASLQPLDVKSKQGFMKLVLHGADFQHARYGFVLSRRLFNLAGLIPPESISEMREALKRAHKTRRKILDTLIFIRGRIALAQSRVDGTLPNQIQNNLPQLLDKVRGDLQLMIVGPGVPTVVQLEAVRDQVTDDIARDAVGDLRNIVNDVSDKIGVTEDLTTNPQTAATGLFADLKSLQADMATIGKPLKLTEEGDEAQDLKEPIDVPSEPYTPLIKSLEMDYQAVACMNDIDLIHLHPFQRTSKAVLLPDRCPPASVAGGGAASVPDPDPCSVPVSDSNAKPKEVPRVLPTLFPAHNDEGTLFIGLDGLRPGANLQLLFQFAEATADSEGKRAKTTWHYLTGNEPSPGGQVTDNRWEPLRRGFEVLSDETQGMTRSGIVKIALPRDIRNFAHTLMPPDKDGKHLYWIKVSAPDSTAAVAELLGVHAQAAAVTWHPLPESDRNRLGAPLAAESIGKPLDPEFSIKTVVQPYESTGGRLAEEVGGHFHTRVSEHLRHKGRSVDTFDIEHLVMEAFPEIYKCKCVTHTMALSAHDYHRDLELAPGFITVAVVPDLSKLKAGDLLEPKVPLSMLTAVAAYLRERISPFARLRVMNPRYERIDVGVTVRLANGSDEGHAVEQLKKDLTRFLAPWYLGGSDKLSFGQEVVSSDVVRFLENLKYIDFISRLELSRANAAACGGKDRGDGSDKGASADNDSPNDCGNSGDKMEKPGDSQRSILPGTARSILTGGRICVELDRPFCPGTEKEKEEKSTTQAGGESPSGGETECSKNLTSFRNLKRRKLNQQP